MLDRLRKQCDNLMESNREKYSIIKEILSHDNCFFEIDAAMAFSILRDLHVQESKLERVYLTLIKKEEYDN